MFVDPTRGPGSLWIESMHQIYGLLRSVNEQGGISAVSASWHRPTTVLFAAELERISANFDGRISELHETTPEPSPDSDETPLSSHGQGGATR
jgi:hypothetical protein